MTVHQANQQKVLSSADIEASFGEILPAVREILTGVGFSLTQDGLNYRWFYKNDASPLMATEIEAWFDIFIKIMMFSGLPSITLADMPKADQVSLLRRLTQNGYTPPWK